MNKTTSLTEKFETFTDSFESKQTEISSELNQLDTRTSEYEQKLVDANEKMAVMELELKDLSAALNRAESQGPTAKDERHDNQMKALSNYLNGGTQGGRNRYEGITSDTADYFTSPTEAKDLSVGVAADGGVLVPEKLQDRITNLERDLTPMDSDLVEQVSLEGTDRYPFNRQIGFAAAGWIAELATRTTTDTPTFDRVEIVAHELYALPQVSLQVLEDSIINLEDFLVNEISKEISVVKNEAFTNGTGVGQPFGLATRIGATDLDDPALISRVSQSASPAVADDIVHADLLEMVYTPRPYARQNAKWMGSRQTLETIRGIVDTAGRPLYDHDYANGAGFSPYVLGFQYVENESVADDTGQDGSPEILGAILYFGDFKRGYIVYNRLGTTILRDPYTVKGQVQFFYRGRWGGDVNDGNALVALVND